MQKVLKPNFPASWDEIGEEYQIEETFALSSMKDISGMCTIKPLYITLCNQKVTCPNVETHVETCTCMC